MRSCQHPALVSLASGGRLQNLRALLRGRWSVVSGLFSPCVSAAPEPGGSLRVAWGEPAGSLRVASGWLPVGYHMASGWPRGSLRVALAGNLVLTCPLLWFSGGVFVFFKGR